MFDPYIKSWRDRSTLDDILHLNGFRLYMRERTGDKHGGICVNAKQNI